MNKYNKYRALEDHCTDGKHIEAIQYKDILKSKKKINQSINQSNVKYQLERAVCDWLLFNAKWACFSAI